MCGPFNHLESFSSDSFKTLLYPIWIDIPSGVGKGTRSEPLETLIPILNRGSRTRQVAGSDNPSVSLKPAQQHHLFDLVVVESKLMSAHRQPEMDVMRESMRRKKPESK